MSTEEEEKDPFAKYRDRHDGFRQKTHGRIWVQKEEDIPRVEAIIKELDEFEHGYMPEDFIAVYNGDLEDVTYGYKFEFSISLLTQACLSRGIWIACVTGIREISY